MTILRCAVNYPSACSFDPLKFPNLILRNTMINYYNNLHLVVMSACTSLSVDSQNKYFLNIPDIIQVRVEPGAQVSH